MKPCDEKCADYHRLWQINHVAARMLLAAGIVGGVYLNQPTIPTAIAVAAAAMIALDDVACGVARFFTGRHP